MHKQIALFIGLTLFLAACTPPAAPPTATQVSLPSVPSVTLTVTPSSTGTATITTTTTPSVTPTTLTPTPMLPSATATLPPPTATATLPPPTATLTLMPTATRATTVKPTRRPSATPIPIPPTPDFSNLGSGKIVFSSQHYNPAAELSIVDLKTNRTLRLIGNLFTNNSAPRLSPDGTKVIFTSLFNGNQEIFMLKVDELTLKNFPEDLEETLNATDWLEKLGITQLTHTDYDESDPTWSPDGKLIAYSAFINNSLVHLGGDSE